jgi:hypothetical protein
LDELDNVNLAILICEGLARRDRPDAEDNIDAEDQVGDVDLALALAIADACQRRTRPRPKADADQR